MMGAAKIKHMFLHNIGISEIWHMAYFSHSFVFFFAINTVGHPVLGTNSDIEIVESQQKLRCWGTSPSRSSRSSRPEWLWMTAWPRYAGSRNMECTYFSDLLSTGCSIASAKRNRNTFLWGNVGYQHNGIFTKWRQSTSMDFEHLNQSLVLYLHYPLLGPNHSFILPLLAPPPCLWRAGPIRLAWLEQVQMVAATEYLSCAALRVAWTGFR